jgi:hypothetical protein
MLMAAIENGEFDSDEKRAHQFLMHNGVVLQSNGKEVNTAAHIPNTWILLDNQSTIDVFQNRNLLTNIRQADGHMDIHCNAGVTSTNMVGDLNGTEQCGIIHKELQTSSPSPVCVPMAIM